jgi:lipid A 3-O-deacylase
MCKIRVILVLFFTYPVYISAQHIDHTASFRQITKPRFFRFHYDNDYFTKTDKYYSQGITLEYVNPRLKNFFPVKLLFTPAKSAAQYGACFNLFGYTPGSIASDSILYGDRPFNANITLKLFSIQPDSNRQQQISAAISIGVMGPAALGYEIQYNIHKWLKNPLPHGWQYQVKNDIILSYQLNYEKKLLGNNRNFLLNATGEARLGTLNINAAAGINFMAGRFNKRFASAVSGNKKAEYYFYAQGRYRLVGYNASLQGGLFNRRSPYIITTSSLRRSVFQADAGLILNLRKILLSYTQSFITKEFSTGTYHRWGGVSVGFTL